MSSPFARAASLRKAASSADVVLLNVSPTSARRGICAGWRAAVVLLNHQDHAFWAGSGGVDLVLDIRTSGQHLTKRTEGSPGLLNFRCLSKTTATHQGLDQVVAPGSDRGRPRTGPLLLTIGRG